LKPMAGSSSELVQVLVNGGPAGERWDGPLQMSSPNPLPTPENFGTTLLGQH
jgi:hypothetical protein